MSRQSFLIRWFLGLGALPALPSCSTPVPLDRELPPPDPASAAEPGDVLATMQDDRALPPDDWAPLARTAHRPGPARLCLLFDGVDIDPDESFIVRRGRTTHVPAFDATPYGVDDRRAAIAHVLARVRRHFAETDLQVSESGAGSDTCTRIVVGGRPTLVGESMGVAGIAPFDIGNRSDDDIGFAFAGALGAGRGEADLDQLADVIAHEAGHTFGLDHVQPVTDLMHPTVNDEMTAFTAAETLDGAWQDAPAMLRAVLGAPQAASPGSSSDPPLARPDCDPKDDVSGETRERARPLVPGRPASGYACDRDEDWFTLDLALGDVVELTLAYPDEAWVEPPELYRPRGRTPVGDAYAEGATHHLVAVADRAGRYRLRIRSPDDSAVRYALRAEITATN
jgi:hypothetical protein